MQCPVCKNVNLVMSERQGIEIDYCPQCRGVWLDRGELDKIIDKSQSAFQSAAPAPMREPPPGPPGYGREPQPPHAPPGGYPPHGGHAQHGGQYGGYYKKKKREGFLSDLFDFD